MHDNPSKLLSSATVTCLYNAMAFHHLPNFKLFVIIFCFFVLITVLKEGS